MKLTEIKKNEGTYVGVSLSPASLKSIRSFTKANGIQNVVPRDKLHITVLYSKKALPSPVAIGSLDPAIKATPTGFDIWKQEDGTNALVLRLSAPKLSDRHKELIAMGGTHDFDDYRPHLTLSYDIGDAFDVDKVSGNIDDIEDLVCTEEYEEPLILDWKDKL